MNEPERQIMSILGEAVEYQSPEERTAFLEKACAGDAGLRARVVEARVFAGLSVEDAAAALGLSRAATYREWAFARAWLATALAGNPKKS